MSTIKMTMSVLALSAGLAVAPALYAQDASSDSASPKTPGTMDLGAMSAERRPT